MAGLRRENQANQQVQVESELSNLELGVSVQGHQPLNTDSPEESEATSASVNNTELLDREDDNEIELDSEAIP